jgi:uncharacterized membrane protein YedE/YeeE
MIDLINQLVYEPWPWYFVGPAIAVTLYLMLYFGREFGVSASLRAGCAALGAGKYSSFFDFDWKSQKWNFMFVLGTVIGGFIATYFMNSYGEVAIAQSTKDALISMGIENPGADYLPPQLFDFENFGIGMILFLLVGGFFVGFGARYGGGCTSGHAISGLSNLQLPSLIAVIGFFIGGLTMTYFILPLIFKMLL